MNKPDLAALGGKFRWEAEEDMNAALVAGIDPVDAYLGIVRELTVQYPGSDPGGFSVPQESRTQVQPEPSSKEFQSSDF